MRYRIKEHAHSVSIRIDAPEGKQEPVRQSLQACAEGHCTCPTPEYDKLESMQVTEAPGRISVTLKSRPGETIDRSAIETCLQHTIDKVERK